ncbi:P-type DNA transfer protein VirB5 [Photobacterium damselae]|uniref:P-type DNA transfer protein VirB5 n=2 Tax=Photobacterium damselae TaxID=38293 RepID=UPI00406831FA
MKKSLLPLLISLFLSAQSHAIPVVVTGDIPGQINQAQNMAQMLKDYANAIDQLEQLRRQVEEARRQYESVTGSRNLGDILDDPSLRQYLPDSWENIYNNLRYNGYDGLTGVAKALRDASRVLDTCQYMTNEQERRNCEAQAVKSSQDKAFLMDAYEKTQQQTRQLKSLQSQINRTQDPKAIAELQARIASEQAAIANNKNAVDIYQATAQAEQQILDQQARELDAKYWTSKEVPPPPKPYKLPVGWK